MRRVPLTFHHWLYAHLSYIREGYDVWGQSCVGEAVGRRAVRSTQLRLEGPTQGREEGRVPAIGVAIDCLDYTTAWIRLWTEIEWKQINDWKKSNKSNDWKQVNESEIIDGNKNDWKQIMKSEGTTQFSVVSCFEKWRYYRIQCSKLFWKVKVLQNSV